jgi:hypothetical protein
MRPMLADGRPIRRSQRKALRRQGIAIRTGFEPGSAPRAARAAQRHTPPKSQRQPK